MTFLISYDLGVPESSEDYFRINQYINDTYGINCKPLYSLWLVVSDKATCKSIADDINSITDSNDKILVMEVSNKGWHTYRMPDNVTSWMRRYI